MVPLGLLSKGEKAEIVDIKAQKVNLLYHVSDIGLHIGKTVEMLNNAGRGPSSSRFDESRIALGRGIAMKIMVKRIENETINA